MRPNSGITSPARSSKGALASAGRVANNCRRNRPCRRSPEHYVRERPLSYHARYLPRDVMWYADPSEPGTIGELRCAGFTVQKADNTQNPGISAVPPASKPARSRSSAAPAPISSPSRSFVSTKKATTNRPRITTTPWTPLRYLIFKLDAKRLARKKRFWQRDKDGDGRERADGGENGEGVRTKLEREWLSLKNEELWTSIYGCEW
jgi:hypothetical protein